MTIYEFTIESVQSNVRLEVQLHGIFDAVKLFRRLDDLASTGVGHVVSSQSGHLHLTDLNRDHAKQLLVGRSHVFVGVPGKPELGTLHATADALKRLPADGTLDAMYYEI